MDALARIFAPQAPDDRPNWNVLLLLQDGIEILQHFGRSPVLRANDLAVNVAGAVDDVSVGIHGGAVVESGFAGWVHRGGESHAVSLQKVGVSGLVVVDADAENGAVTGCDFLLQLIEGRRFVNAGRTPTGPEIEDDDFAAKVGEVRGFAIEREGKILGCSAVETWLALTIVRMSEDCHEARYEDERGARAEIAF